MASRVAISRVESRDQRGSEREACAFESLVRSDDCLREVALFLIEAEELLRGERWHEEQYGRPRRNVLVGESNDGNNGCVERNRRQLKAHDRMRGFAEAI